MKSKNKLRKLRPQGWIVDRPSPYRWNHILKTGRKHDFTGRGYNWYPRGVWSHPIITRPDMQQIIHGAIHYLTGHAPKAVQARWKTAEKRWRDRCRYWKAGINDRI